MKNPLKKIVNRYKKYIFVADSEKSFLNKLQHPQITEKVKNEDLFIRKWSGLGLDVNPVYYRVYCNHSPGNDINLVPLDIYFIVILKKLNNYNVSQLYADKNLYEKRIRSNLFPKTFLRNINGTFYSAGYDLFKPDPGFFKRLSTEAKQLIVKPSIHSGGGVNLKKFEWNGDSYVDENSKSLNTDYLEEHYQKDYLVQEVIAQHPYMQRLNPSSVNTMRVLTYRSVKNEMIKILGTYLRVGKHNSLVDNFSSGGYLIHYNQKGEPDMYAVLNMDGTTDTINGVCISDMGIYPEYDKVISCAKKIASLFPYQRMLGLDMVVDQKNQVKFIEVNTYKIGPFAFSGYPVFGEYTDEIIHYCREKAGKKGEWQ